MKYFNKKSLALFILIAFLGSFLAGCAGEAPKEESGEKGRTVVDMAGRTVTLPEEIKSIATFGSIGVLNTFVELMGDGDKIVNEMSPSFTKTDKWKYQYKFAPQLKQSPVFEDANREILMEEVLKVKPDLSLTMDKETAGVLEKQGLNVIYLDWNEDEDVKKCITLLGEILNKKEVAEDYIKYFDDRVAKAIELTKNLKEEDKKTVLYGNITEFNQPHLIAEWWIPKAGGLSVTDGERASNKMEYTMEDLLQWNPDVMVLATASTKKDILADQRLAHITAVKNDAIYATPTVAHVWGNRTPEQPLTIMWMMNKLYPELMSTKDLGEEIKYFYSHFFKYEMTEEEIGEIIK